MCVFTVIVLLFRSCCRVHTFLLSANKWRVAYTTSRSLTLFFYNPRLNLWIYKWGEEEEEREKNASHTTWNNYLFTGKGFFLVSINRKYHRAWSKRKTDRQTTTTKITYFVQCCKHISVDLIISIRQFLSSMLTYCHCPRLIVRYRSRLSARDAFALHLVRVLWNFPTKNANAVANYTGERRVSAFTAYRGRLAKVHLNDAWPTVRRRKGTSDTERSHQSNFNIGYELTWKIWLFCALLTLGGIFYNYIFISVRPQRLPPNAGTTSKTRTEETCCLRIYCVHECVRELMSMSKVEFVIFIRHFEWESASILPIALMMHKNVCFAIA